MRFFEETMIITATEIRWLKARYAGGIMSTHLRHGLAVIIFFIFLVMASTCARSAPPPDVAIDPELSEFFRSLRSPTYGFSCCDVSDCRRLPSRQVGSTYQVLISGSWVEVPNDVIIRGRENPVGEAVTCYLPHFGIVCFLPGSLT
jgi:hypothetical protein